MASPQGLQLRQWFQSGGWMSPASRDGGEVGATQHAALHRTTGTRKESPSDEQMMIHGWAVISIKSLGSDPRLLCRVPSRHSLSESPTWYFTAGTVITNIDSLGRSWCPSWGSQQSAANKATHSPQKGQGVWSGAPQH